MWLLWVPDKACFVKHPRKTTHNKCNTQAKINQGTFSTNRRLIPWKMGIAQVKRAYPIDPIGLVWDIVKYVSLNGGKTIDGNF